MTIALKNLTRQPASYTLTLDCVTPELPVTVGIRMKTVYAESYPHKPALIAETVKNPPTITISAREVIKGLPDAVVFAPEIQGAVAAKHLAIITEAVVENVYRRPTVPSADPAPENVHVSGSDDSTTAPVAESTPEVKALGTGSARPARTTSAQTPKSARNS